MNALALRKQAAAPPRAELRVMKELSRRESAITVPELVNGWTKGEKVMSDSATYTLLGRLADRGFVTRKEKAIEVTGKTLLRVTWRLSPQGKRYMNDDKPITESEVFIE
jgi:predicted transcriptional regulator